jgi:hypothetical protein
MAAPSSIDVLYPVRRAPGLDGPAFASRWAEHVELLVRLGLLDDATRYSQCVAVPPHDTKIQGTAIEPMSLTGHAGLGWVVLPGLDALDRARHHPMLGQVMADQRETFGAAIEPDQLLISRRTTMFERTADAPVKHIGFLRRSAEFTRTEFLRHWEHFARSVYLPNPSSRMPRYYIQHRALLQDEGGDDASFDGAWEQGFGSVEELAAYISAPATSDEVFPEEFFIDQTYSIFQGVTDRVLYDRDGQVAHQAAG